MGNYKKCHMYFLQAMMNRGSVTEAECIRLCQECCRITNIDFSGDIQNFLRVINDKINSLHFKIGSGKREDTGEVVYAFASMADNNLNRLVVGGDFARVELEFLRRTLDLIVHADVPPNVGIVSSVDLLNMADSLSPKMSKADAKKLLSRLVKDKWLMDNDGMISMTPRCILELEQYLCNAHEGFVFTCHMCSTNVFQGQSCTGCDMKMHHQCAKSYFSTKSALKCGECEAKWEFQQSTEANGNTSNALPHSSRDSRPSKRSRLAQN